MVALGEWLDGLPAQQQGAALIPAEGCIMRRRPGSWHSSLTASLIPQPVQARPPSTPAAAVYVCRGNSDRPGGRCGLLHPGSWVGAISSPGGPGLQQCHRAPASPAQDGSADEECSGFVTVCDWSLGVQAGGFQGTVALVVGGRLPCLRASGLPSPAFQCSHFWCALRGCVIVHLSMAMD